jgi:putative addiction module component (TIGR02574 family)
MMETAMPTYESVFDAAARLSIADRIRLIDGIWDTLPAETLPPLHEEWTAEIQRRSADYDAGATETISWHKVKTDALRRVGMTVADALD